MSMGLSLGKVKDLVETGAKKLGVLASASYKQRVHVSTAQNSSQ